MTGPRDWTPAQFEELQLHALAALSTLGPLMIDEYMICQGSTRLLLLLEWCTGTGSLQSIITSIILCLYFSKKVIFVFY